MEILTLCPAFTSFVSFIQHSKFSMAWGHLHRWQYLGSVHCSCVLVRCTPWDCPEAIDLNSYLYDTATIIICIIQLHMHCYVGGSATDCSRLLPWKQHNYLDASSDVSVHHAYSHGAVSSSRNFAFSMISLVLWPGLGC